MRRFSWTLAVLLLACAGSAFAQGTGKKKGDEASRSVQGVVTTADDKSAPGAIVQLKNTKTLAIRSFITKENGEYYFHGLSPDVDYELNAKSEDGSSSSSTKTLSSFDSRKTATLNLKLNPKK